MERKLKPAPSQYGLTEEAAARLAEIDSGDSTVAWRLYLTTAVLCCLLVGGGILAASGNLFFAVVGALFAVFNLEFPAFAAPRVLNRLFPQLRDYRAYRDACKEYERRLAEHELQLDLQRYEAERHRKEQEHQLELKRLAYWQGLTYAQLENEVAALFRRLGHRARVLGGSGDGGVDVAVDDDTIVQCKAYAKPLSPAAVRELLGTKTALGARRAILVCTAGFTAGSRKFAESSGVELWDAHELVRLHDLHQPREGPGATAGAPGAGHTPKITILGVIGHDGRFYPPPTGGPR
jgi:HJR/Mrr/RecB family endonuclease